MTLQELQDWVDADKDDRHVNLEIKNKGTMTCWVWSSRLMAGMYVKEVSEIDLDGQVLRAEKVQYEKLRAKFSDTPKFLKPDYIMDNITATNEAYRKAGE